MKIHDHQKYSGPVMEKFHIWLNQQIEEKESEPGSSLKSLVEPNSSLGKAIKYVLRHWEKLTRFLYVEGAPIVNNICLSSFLENPQDCVKEAKIKGF